MPVTENHARNTFLVLLLCQGPLRADGLSVLGSGVLGNETERVPCRAEGGLHAPRSHSQPGQREKRDEECSCQLRRQEALLGTQADGAAVQGGTSLHTVTDL